MAFKFGFPRMNLNDKKGKSRNKCRRERLQTFRPQLEALEDRLVPSYITGITVHHGQPVVGSGGALINTYYGLNTLADEHSTIVPNANGSNDYTFYVASRTTANPASSGLVMLSGTVKHHQWTIDTTGPSPSQIFISPVVHGIAVADPTFDLNYAAPGSVLVDPTGPPGSTLMVYSATNKSIGLEPGSKTTSNKAYNSVGIATSDDGGLTWPTYAAVKETLPNQSSTKGPDAPLGATFTQVDQGSSSPGIPGSSAAYGRYSVLGPATPIQIVITEAGNNGLPKNMGDGSPSGFIDTYNRSSSTYLYVVDDYLPGDGTSLLTVSRAALNGGSAPLTFSRWANGRFSPSATSPSPIGFLPGPKSAFQSGIDSQLQTQTAGSISYVPSTGQYLLTFVCISDGDPATGKPGLTGAWFFATNRDLSNEAGWSQPQLIQGSDHPITSANGANPDIVFSGWYPSFMSLSTVPQGDPGYMAPGELGLNGYAFYMTGSRGDPTANGRSFDSVYFTIDESCVPEPASATAVGHGAPSTLTGNDMGNLLIGGAGSNTITAGTGLSLLIAGTDSSNITGGSGGSSTGGGNEGDGNLAGAAGVHDGILGVLKMFDGVIRRKSALEADGLATFRGPALATSDTTIFDNSVDNGADVYGNLGTL